MLFACWLSTVVGFGTASAETSVHLPGEVNDICQWNVIEASLQSEKLERAGFKKISPESENYQRFLKFTVLMNQLFASQREKILFDQNAITAELTRAREFVEIDGNSRFLGPHHLAQDVPTLFEAMRNEAAHWIAITPLSDRAEAGPVGFSCLSVGNGATWHAPDNGEKVDSSDISGAFLDVSTATYAVPNGKVILYTHVVKPETLQTVFNPPVLVSEISHLIYLRSDAPEVFFILAEEGSP